MERQPVYYMRYLTLLHAIRAAQADGLPKGVINCDDDGFWSLIPAAAEPEAS